MRPEMPVRMRAIEDLSRSRLTVFFRLLLAIPHILWLAIWSVGVFFVALVAWFVVLIKGEMPAGLHRFFTMYIRYATHVYAYLNLAANPFPGFLGEDSYEIDVEFDPPARQNRWTVGFRLILAIPVLMLATVLTSETTTFYARSNDTNGTYAVRFAGVLSVCAFLTWFYALVKARAPEGITRLQWYALHYGAQAAAYLLLVTDRYPTSDPERVGVPWPAPEHPVTLRHVADDGTRSRLTVFFRLLLAVPHLVWLTLWAIAVVFVAFVNWIVTIVRGQSPEPLHRFLAAFLRYEIHVVAYIALVANPFPGFTGEAGSYPVDLEVAPPRRQNRWGAGFRIFLAIPAFILSSAIAGALYVAALLGWFAALFTARMPSGLRKLGLLALRYSAQANGYGYLLLTDRYPYAGPPA